MAGRLNFEKNSLYINKFMTGLYKRRSPLFTPLSSMGLQIIQRQDSFWDGQNIDVSHDMTIIRRQGFTRYCSTALSGSNYPQSFFSFKNVSGAIKALVETSTAVSYFTSSTVTQAFPKSGTAQGSINKVGDMLYYCDGTQLKAEGVPVVSPEGGLDYNAASQLIQARRSADPSSMLQYVMHSNANGKYDVYQVQNPGKVIDNPVDAIIGYDDNHKPITQHYAPNTITVGQLMNIQTNAAVNYVNKQNDLTEFKKKNAITVGGEIAVAKAKQQMDSSPVYAIDSTGQTVLTTKAGAIQNGMSGIRAVKEGDISKDQHDIKVLSDIQTKSNNVAQAAGAMDSKSWTQAARVAKYLADNPNSTTQNLVRAGVLDGMTPQAKNYAINVMSLRESAMGLQKVLTGSARNSESQIGALMNTLPGFEPDSATVKQKLQAFDQNLGLLAQGLPKNTGVELKGFNGGGQVAVGTTKTFPNGKVGVWDGTGWAAQ